MIYPNLEVNFYGKNNKQLMIYNKEYEIIKKTSAFRIKEFYSFKFS